MSLEEMDAVFDDRVGTMDEVVRGQVRFLFFPLLFEADEFYYVD